MIYLEFDEDASTYFLLLCRVWSFFNDQIQLIPWKCWHEYCYLNPKLWFLQDLRLSGCVCRCFYFPFQSQVLFKHSWVVLYNLLIQAPENIIQKTVRCLFIVVTPAYRSGAWQSAGGRISCSPGAALRTRTGNTCGLWGHTFQFNVASCCYQVCVCLPVCPELCSSPYGWNSWETVKFCTDWCTSKLKL